MRVDWLKPKTTWYPFCGVETLCGPWMPCHGIPGVQPSTLFDDYRYGLTTAFSLLMDEVKDKLKLHCPLIENLMHLFSIWDSDPSQRHQILWQDILGW